MADNLLLKLPVSASNSKEFLEVYLERFLTELVDAGDDEGMGLDEALTIAGERAKKKKKQVRSSLCRICLMSMNGAG